MPKLFEYLALFLLVSTAFTSVALQLKLVGWILFVIGLLVLFLCRKEFRKNVFLPYIAVGILSIMPISTDIGFAHILIGGPLIIASVAVPYCISRYVYKTHVIRFPFHHGRSWYKTEIAYIALTAVLAYLILPYYLVSTGSYLNWTVEPNASSLIRLFIACMLVGIWDELFFVSTILGTLRRFFSFPIANVAQAIIFTSFLYELGFRSWGVIPIFIFTLTQGYIFKRTDSLLYVITIHLTLDIILFLVLIYAHNHSWMPIFFS